MKTLVTENLSRLIILLTFTVCFIAPVEVKSWPYGQTKIRGVNIGSWLVLEKWITPSIFSGLPDSVVDEYSLCKHLGYSAAEAKLRSHWETWFTEKDVIQMKNVGINHLRIPIGYWAFDIRQGEPWVKGSWDYAMKAVGWAKKHGLQVMIDLHGAPGSQNGNDHSGRNGSIEFFNSDENINRSVNIIGQIARTANSSEWRDTISIIQLLNEPILWGNDYNYRLERLKTYYRRAYDEVRRHSSVAVVAVHDAFIDLPNWYYLRDDAHYFGVMLDTHLYQVFTPAWNNLTCEEQAHLPCRVSQSLPEANNKLWTIVGEWSLSTPNPCKNQAEFAKQQIGVYETASGWYYDIIDSFTLEKQSFICETRFFWSLKHEGWPEWSFQDAIRNGWINLYQDNTPKC